VISHLWSPSSPFPDRWKYGEGRFARQMGKQITGVAQDTMESLSRYDWPGNIRELQNVIERAVVLSRGTVLRLGLDLLPVTTETLPEEAIAIDSSSNGKTTGDDHFSLEQVERRHILQVLKQAEWVIEGQNCAARILDLHPNTLRSRMKKLGLDRSAMKSAPSHDIS
jgi:formate hydrogenlyase transcriptional activator